MADLWAEVVSSNVTHKYIVQIIGSDAIKSTPDFIFLLILSLIIGFASLTIRYTLNPKDKSEYALWKNEHWPTKIFLCFMVGALSFASSEMFIEFFRVVNNLVTGVMQDNSYFVGNGMFGNIFLAVLISSSFMIYRFRRGDRDYMDLKKFLIFSSLGTFMLALISASILLIHNSLLPGIMFALITLLVVFALITPFINSLKK